MNQLVSPLDMKSSLIFASYARLSSMLSLGVPKVLGSNKIHDSKFGQYGAWLRASPKKIPWKTQTQNNHLGSSSFGKQKDLEVEETLATNSRGENLEKFESKRIFLQGRNYWLLIVLGFI